MSDTIIKHQPYIPYVLSHIQEGNMRLDELFQTVIETDSEETCETALNLVNSVLHTQVILNKLMGEEYDTEV